MIYVDAVRGNDATGVRGQPDKPFKTLLDIQYDFGDPLSTNGALTVAQPGDVIKLSAGVFTNNLSIALPPNCSLIGAGRDLTILRSTAPMYSYGPVVQPGDNSQIGGLTIECLPITDTFRNALGVNMLKGDPFAGTRRAFTNVLVFNARLRGQSDAVYIDHTNTVSARFYDVEMESDWDGVLFSTRGNTQSTLEFYDCSIAIQSRPTISHSYVSGLVVDEGTIRWHGGSISVRDGPLVTMAVWGRRSGSNIELYNTRLFSVASYGLVLDIFSLGSTRALGVSLDTNKVAGAGTTFLQAWPADGARLSATKAGFPLYTLHNGGGQNYRVDISSNLVDWTPFVVFPNAPAKLDFADPTTAGAPRRFYRLQPLP